MAYTSLLLPRTEPSDERASVGRHPPAILNIRSGENICREYNMGVRRGASRDRYYCACVATTQTSNAIDMPTQTPNFAAVNPPFVYGPLAPGYEVTTGDMGALCSNAYFYGCVFLQTSTNLLPLQVLPPHIPWTCVTSLKRTSSYCRLRQRLSSGRRDSSPSGLCSRGGVQSSIWQW